MTGAIDRILGDGKRFASNLPSTARVSVMRQNAEARHVVHLLYANTITRGAEMTHTGGSNQSNANRLPKPVEVIDELLPLYDVDVTLRLPQVRRVTLQPQGTEIGFESTAEGVRFRIGSFICHQMVVVE